MRCRKCDYRLWNLPSRACPECGTPFLPSEYQFVVNSVQFCCPHCDEPYYGTGRKGHLVPMAFDCASCGQGIHMDEMVLLPTAGIEEERTQVDRVPWLDRKQRGFIAGWLSTVGMALVQPHRLMRAVPEAGSTGQAWGFAMLTNTLALVVSVSPFLVLPIAVAFVAGGRGGARPVATVAGSVMGIGFVLLVVAGLAFVSIAVWGAVTHGLLRATGETAGTMKRTYQAICYASGANIFTALPCVGIYCGWIWWLISAVLMVKVGQQVQGWRAALAVLTLPAVLIFAFVALYALIVIFAITGAL
ncbi:MAG: YIP1 family protein [Phycisphaerales bacterium]|nr:MAG: YIP1 family protein [Phycisphaerales bacterium]